MNKITSASSSTSFNHMAFVEKAQLYNISTLIIFQQNSKVQASNVRIMQPTNKHTQALPPRITQTWLHSPSTLWGHDSPPSDMLNVRRFLTPPQAQKAPTASPLTASVPELRFSTRAWWSCRDALSWARADIESSMQTGTNPVNEQSRESPEKHTGGYC